MKLFKKFMKKEESVDESIKDFYQELIEMWANNHTLEELVKLKRMYERNIKEIDDAIALKIESH